MDELEEKDPSHCVKTEKVLPSVIKAESTNCLLCGRIRKFYACRPCHLLGQLSFLIQLPNSDSIKYNNKFPGFICGETKDKIEQLKTVTKCAAENLEKTNEAGRVLKQKNQLLFNIIQAKKQIDLLKKVRILQSDGMKSLQRQKRDLELNVEQLKRRTQRVKMKKQKITEYMTMKKTMIKKFEVNLEKETKVLQELQKHQVLELVTHIFPIVGLSQDDVFESSEDLQSQDRSSDDNNMLEEALAEARRLSFVHGRWIYDQGEAHDLLRMSIGSNKSFLPADGDYSACESWLRIMASSTGASPESSSDVSASSAVEQLEPHNSPGASIFAALYLTSQLMNSLKKILCIHMPYKHHYKQFNNQNMTVQEFLWNVRRLNGNILALCLYYGVDPHLIHPLHTLPNLQNAVQMFLHNGNRILSSSFSEELISSIEDALNESSDPLPDDDEDRLEEMLSEWENSLVEEDWDALMPQTSSNPTSPQYTSAAPFQSQAQQDDMGTSQGLVSSAVAWVTKGWWNR